MENNYEETNYYILEKLSNYLNNNSDYIDNDMINKLIDEVDINEEEAFRILLATILDVSENECIMSKYFPLMLKKLEENDYINNPYYKNIKLEDILYNNWSFKNICYKPYELFVYDDLERLEDGRLIPHIGYFSSQYKYPCIYQNNREWMMITPNEINTMKRYIDEAYGHVVTYGLGLGYYAYMVSLKENVSKITIVEKDKEVIDLFNKYILPQFKNKDKIEVINMDAFKYNENVKCDYLFIDIWHDPSDGIELYRQFKMVEKPGIKYGYWIEKTMLCYIQNN